MQQLHPSANVVFVEDNQEDAGADGSKTTSSGGSTNSHPPQQGRPQQVDDLGIQDLGRSGELKGINDTHHLEAFESWVRSGEWKKFFPFGDLVPINSEEVSNFGGHTESRATSDAQMGRSRSLPNFNTARLNQGQALTTQDYNISSPTHHPGMLNGFPPAHDSGTVHSSDPVNNNGMADGFSHTSNAAVVQAHPHADPAGVQEQVPLPLCSECKSHLV